MQIENARRRDPEFLRKWNRDSHNRKRERSKKFIDAGIKIWKRKMRIKRQRQSDWCKKVNEGILSWFVTMEKYLKYP